MAIAPARPGAEYSRAALLDEVECPEGGESQDLRWLVAVGDAGSCTLHSRWALAAEIEMGRDGAC